MAVGIGMRTIWVALRAVNYSKPAFHAAESSVKSLTAWQERFMKQQKRLEQQSRMMIGVGLMYIAMGAMAGFAMMKLIGLSREGSQYMEKFAQVAEKAGAQVGTALLEVLKPALDTVMVVLRFIAENKALAQMVAGLIVLTTTLLLFNGILKLIQGALIRTSITALTANTGFFTLKHGFDMTNISAMGLLTTVQTLFAIFYIFYAVSTALAEALGGPLQAALVMLIPLLAIMVGLLWTGASAMSVLTIGAAAAAGIAGMLALQAVGPPQYQTGTRFAQRTQLAVIHAGETVTQARDVPAMQKPNVTYSETKVDMRGMTIQTKADKEELRPFILRTIRDANRAKE